MKRTLFFLLAIAFLMLNYQAKSQTMDSQSSTEKTELSNNEKLVIIWTSGDREVADKMVFLYTLNSRRFKWWDDITLIVWGPSAKLLTEDKELQEKLKKILDAGVVVKACKACADDYGISDDLEKLGIEVKYVAEVTTYIKEGRHILTF